MDTIRYEYYHRTFERAVILPFVLSAVIFPIVYYYLSICAAPRRSNPPFPRLFLLLGFDSSPLYFHSFIGLAFVVCVHIRHFIMWIQSGFWVCPLLGWMVVDALTVDTSQAGMFVWLV